MQERERELRLKLASVLPLMNELQRRIVVAAEARAYGRGGVQTLAQITGMSRQTIYRGLQELLAKRKKPSGRIRRPGGGRKRLRDQYPRLVETLERLIEPTVRGDPQTLLRWTCKSVRNLEAELEREGYTVSYRTIANLLHAQEYTLQANRKSREGQEDHPDRDAQFRYINEQAMQFLKRTVPVISVDTKKKELLGNYKNAGREWQRQGEGWEVLSHDFPDPSVRKRSRTGSTTGGEHRLGQRRHGCGHGGVCGGEYPPVVAAHGQAALPTRSGAADLCRQWRQQRLSICTCGSGNCSGWPASSDSRSRCATSRPAPASGTRSSIGSFSYITLNWRGRPLANYRTVVSLIAATNTRTGLIVKARLDRNTYARGIKVSAGDEKSKLQRHEFHGEWNYTIKP